MSKIDQNSIIMPTDEELVIYEQLVKDVNEEQLDELANEYFDLVREDQINVSFPRFLIDKFIRPIKEGDTIHFYTEEKQLIYMFCLLRKEIESKEYLLFAKADPENETLSEDEVYLFFVDGVDNIGTEILDIIPSGEETERILNIMEAELDARNSDMQ